MSKPENTNLSENEIDLSERSVTESEELFTEHLAAIYVKQGKPEKAIQIYEHLKLKFPDKKTYFAVRIEKIKE